MSAPSLRNLIQIVEDNASARRPDPRSNAAFKAWFGKSTVVDGAGRPLVLYHGTGADVQSFRGMVWGSVDASLASDYAEMRDQFANGGGNVMPLYMRIERPLDGDQLGRDVTVKSFFAGALAQAEANGVLISGELRQTVEDMMRDTRNAARREESGPDYFPHDFWNETVSSFGRDGAATIRKLFDVLGFDGIRNTELGVLTYGAFTPGQVKSVFSKAFNPYSPNVSESRG